MSSETAQAGSASIRMLNIGYGNMVLAARVVAIVAPQSSPMRRLREEAGGRGKLVDATQGRRTRSVIITDSDHVILSAINPDTIAARLLETRCGERVTAERAGIPFVAAAPSGTGKTTICRSAIERDDHLRFSISHTTRPMRPGEVDGRDYYFVTAERFRHLVTEGKFIEHAEYAGHLYGTSRDALEGPLGDGFDLLIEIEVQGARQLRETRQDARFLFLLPPDFHELERRLRERGTDAPDVVEHRLALADRELEAVKFFDYAIVNDEVEQAVEAVLAIVKAERNGQTEGVRARFGRDRVLAGWPGWLERRAR